MEKIKINNSITKKMFIVCTALFILFTTTILIFQSSFFNKFYIYKKKRDIQNNIEKFKTNYDKVVESDEFTNVVMNFEENYNVKIAILNSNGQLKFVTKSNNQKVDTQKINIINQIINEISGTINNIKITKQTVTYITNSNNDVQYIVSISPDTNRDEVIIFLSSLQPINEATSTIKEFYTYFYAGATFFIFILSFIFSKMITKPLLNINKTALNMAQLDFSQKCDVNSEDEIGSLANSLNVMSENLNNALNSLKVANLKLEGDIEKERQLDKDRKEFVAAVSHELKTPIALIKGYTEGLKDDVFEESDRDYYLDVIIDESDKMGELVSDMLDLSQLEYGKFKLLKEDFYIDELIENTVKKFSNICNEKSIKINLELAKNLKVNADFTRIEQVVKNYLTNAIKHTDSNGSIFIKSTFDNNFAMVEFRNVGENIPDEELNKIWDNFYKVDKSRNRGEGGTGIGLAIVKNIILLHKGRYGVENTEDGVIFNFALPI